MNGRALAAETASLTAGGLWVYAGAALVVATVGDGASLSPAAVAAVIVLSYGLTRLLRQLDLEQGTLRLWGAGLSIALLYLILRIDIAGEPYLWRLGWIGDLLSDPGKTLEGRGSAAAEVIVLAAAWGWGITQGGRLFTLESALRNVSLGLIVVVVVSAMAPSADAPNALRWLPLPYLAAGLLTLALAHFLSVELDRHRPFLYQWALWMGGMLGAMGGIALLASYIDLPPLSPVGEALQLALRGVVLGIAVIVAPLILGFAWVLEIVFAWLASDDLFVPEEVDTSQLMEEVEQNKGGPPRWAFFLGVVLRGGAIALGFVLALTLLWFLFRRFFRRSEDEAEVREEVTAEAGDLLGDLRSLFTGALGRLRGRGAGGLRGYDAIGRLYLSMLSRAEAGGLLRSPATTPSEFAPRLDAHFGSDVPGEISQAYAEARYGDRLRPEQQIDELRSRWDELSNMPKPSS